MVPCPARGFAPLPEAKPGDHESPPGTAPLGGFLMRDGIESGPVRGRLASLTVEAGVGTESG